MWLQLFVYILQLKKCYTISPVFSRSGHHSDGIVCTALESGLICCWVTELQGGLTISLRTIGHTSGTEAIGSWFLTSPLPYYPDTWGTCEVSGASVGVGGAGVVYYGMNCINRLNHKYIPLAGRETVVERDLLLPVLLPLGWTQTVYFMLHWRLGKVALAALVLSTVYIIREPLSGW